MQYVTVRKPACKMDDCDEHVIAKDLCTTHYRRLIRTGSPYGVRRVTRAVVKEHELILDDGARKKKVLRKRVSA